MWAGGYYDHDRLDLYTCGRHKLRYWDFENRLTSFINNQTYQTVAMFWIWTGSEWDEFYRSWAPETEPDLGGTSVNNRIDMVEPC